MELKFDVAKVTVVDIGKVRPNTYNPKDKNTEDYTNVRESIRQKGQRLPIVVRQIDDWFEIIDGEQRYDACKELGFTQVIIYNEGVTPDKEARELTVAFQQQVPFNEVKLAFLIKEMVDQYGKIEIPLPEDKIEDLLKLANFDWNKVEGDKEVPIETFKRLTLDFTDEQYEMVMQALGRIQNELGCSMELAFMEILKRGVPIVSE
ncbi:MAG: ParB/RepB/Spo0J family partition protein [Gallionella sp.]